MIYQKPENYVRDFVNEVLAKLNGTIKREEVTMDGRRLYVDYQYGKILIEAKAPGKRVKGREQLLEYMKKFGYRLGLLIDIPVERYYSEYPRPFMGRVGFELYLEESCIYERSFDRNEISNAKKELGFLLKVINELKIASIEPKPENVLVRIKNIVNKWEKELVPIATSTHSRTKIYMTIWRKNMELLYGKEVLENMKRNLAKLFVELTIYTTVLKILGSTILESMLGGGKYTIPLKLLQEGYKAAIELFWERKALTRFNINYMFERDEYDWIFAPEVAKDLDEFFRDIGKELIEIDWSRPIGLDLLKRIYQNIVDVNLRRQLGEFYTPDWLAKLIVWRALHLAVNGKPPKEIFTENIDTELVDLINKFYERRNRLPSFIDPTCGSFTFGVQYLDALLRWYNTRRPAIHPVNFAYILLQNVVGIDLNPVAVITAKVNYLLQIYRLLVIHGNYLYEEPMIPIYRVDLLILHEVERTKETRAKSLLYYLSPEYQELVFYIPLSSLGVEEGEVNKLKAKGIPIIHDGRLGEYYIRLGIPRTFIQKTGKNLAKLHRALIALHLRGIEGFKNEINIALEEKEEKAIANMVKTVKVLEEHGIDDVWYSIFMNYILAIVAVQEKFDLVLGNLPWVNVSKYPNRYRDKLRRIAKELGVYPPKEAARKLDISVILYAISAKYLLKRDGVIALMVPASIFRGLHGCGWRSFFIDEGLRIHEAFDLEHVRPFEGAQNQPGIVFAKR